MSSPNEFSAVLRLTRHTITTNRMQTHQNRQQSADVSIRFPPPLPPCSLALTPSSVFLCCFIFSSWLPILCQSLLSASPSFLLFSKIRQTRDSYRLTSSIPSACHTFSTRPVTQNLTSSPAIKSGERTCCPRPMSCLLFPDSLRDC